ncbi:ABC-2 family transporter protein [Actinomycetes bacterium KLBMP 9797]
MVVKRRRRVFSVRAIHRCGAAGTWHAMNAGGYLKLAGAGFRRFTAYRRAAVAGLVANVVFAVIRQAILLAAVSESAGIAGYDAVAVGSYVWLGQGLYSVVLLWGDSELAGRIRGGGIVIDLCRPWDLQLALFAGDLGRAAFAVPMRLLPPVIVGAALFPFRWPEELLTWPLLAVSVGLALVVSFGLRFLVNLATFWTMEIRGIAVLYGVVSGVLSGLTLPVDFFPGWARTALWCTPFPAMLQAPVTIFVENGSPDLLLLHQAGYAVALILLGRAVLSRARRKLVVQGG